MFLTKLRILVSAPRKPRHLWISCVLKFSNICCFRCWAEDYSSLVCHMCFCPPLAVKPPSLTPHHSPLLGVNSTPPSSSIPGHSRTGANATYVRLRLRFRDDWSELLIVFWKTKTHFIKKKHCSRVVNKYQHQKFLLIEGILPSSRDRKWPCIRGPRFWWQICGVFSKVRVK